MKKQIIIIFLLTLGSISLFGQTQKAFVEAADLAMKKKNYYAALSYYQDALAFDQDNIDMRYKVAESARLFMSYKIAEEQYTYVKENDGDNAYPLCTYYLGEMLQKQGKYEEAAEMYNLYLTENSGDDEYYTFKADKEREACKWAMNEINTEDESIRVKNVGNTINTEHSDFAPTIYEDQLYFSSKKFNDPSIRGEFVAQVEKVKIPESYDDAFGSPEPITDGINIAGKNTANTAFNKDKTKIFYTVCERLNDSDIRCDLYCKEIKSDGTFGEGMKLPDFINKAGYTTTQPTIGYDKTTDKEILYFASDRPGGKGKLDLWYAVIDNKNNFTSPRNLVDINTKEDELTPFFHIPSSTLYFSTDGYRSFGGYDVYSSKFNGTNYSEPAHLGNPLNSSYHDIYFVLSDDEEHGYFSTNREGAQFLDNSIEACCFDIYRVKFEPLNLNLNGLTYDKTTQESLEGATVKLYDEDTGELLDSLTNFKTNDHLFKLKRCTNYLIVGEKLGYKSDTIKYSTCGLKGSTDVVKKLFLKADNLELDVFTFDETTLKALSGATVVLTNTSRPDQEPIVIKNPTANDFKFIIRRGDNYVIDISRPGYFPAKVPVITDEINDTKITKNIYLKKDVVGELDLRLPVTLYFDNDRPNPRTTRRTSRLSYSDTYNRYIKRKSIFEKRSADKDGVRSFFDVEVAGNYAKFQGFLVSIQPVLATGESIEIILRGHASPLSATNYNLFLGQRRISTVLNEISRFGGGVLKTYLDSGQLKITNVSYGEEMAPAYISDNRKDRKASVYSVEASKARNVEILEVIRQ